MLELLEDKKYTAIANQNIISSRGVWVKEEIEKNQKVMVIFTTDKDSKIQVRIYPLIDNNKFGKDIIFKLGYIVPIDAHLIKEGPVNIFVENANRQEGILHRLKTFNKRENSYIEIFSLINKTLMFGVFNNELKLDEGDYQTYLDCIYDALNATKYEVRQVALAEALEFGLKTIKLKKGE